MKFNQLLKSYVNDREPRERKIGRYHSSELYNIMEGKLSVEEFFQPKHFNLTACRNIAEGELREEGIKWVFDASELPYKYQEKSVYPWVSSENEEQLEIVSVADFCFPKFVLETKSTAKIGGIKPYHLPQLEAQYRIFKLPVYVMYMRERWDYKVYKYEPDRQLWFKIIKKVELFDKQLRINN